jgi:vacuolar-type H+-ATPase subunit H
MSYTPEDLIKIVKSAVAIVQDSIEKAKNSNTSQVIRDEINENADEIQQLINSILNSAGAVTQDQINQLDYKIRMQKIRTLELSSKKTKKTFAIIIGGVIIGVVALLYLTRKKQ